MDFVLSEAAAKARLQQVAKELAIRKATIDDFKDRIAALQYELEDATDAYDQAMVEHRRVLALFPPVSRLPYELLAEIFSMANTEFRSARMARKDMYWALDLPVRLSHVSRRFRHIALTTASLWTNIYIYKYPLLPRTTLYLSRCQGAPLDIRVSNLWEIYDLSSMDRLIQLLSPASRWRSLCVKDGPIVVHHFMRRAGPAANLHRLEVKMTRSYSPDRGPLEVLSPFDGCAPVLSSMTLINVASRWSPSVYACLTDLTLSFSNAVEDHLNLLRHTQRLKRLVAVGDIPEDLPRVSGVVVLDVLESFTFFAARDPSSVGFIWSCLSMPALRSLTLKLASTVRYDEAFDLFDPSHYPALHSLSLSGVMLPDAVGFASRFPTIENLHIHNRVDIIQRLTETMDPCHSAYEDTIVFPNLQQLEFSAFDCYSDIVLLLRFLELRRLRKLGPYTVLLPRDTDLTKPSTNKIDLEQLQNLVIIETRVEEEDQSWDTDSEAGSESNVSWDSDW